MSSITLKTYPLAITLLTITVGQSAVAEPFVPQPKVSERYAAKQAEMLRDYDKNGNGVLDPDERSKMIEDNAAKVLKARNKIVSSFDANHDGNIDSAETKNIQKYQGIVPKSATTDVPTSPAALKANRVATASFFDSMNKALLKEYDVNGNGVIDPDEQRAMDARAQELMQ